VVERLVRKWDDWAWSVRLSRPHVTRLFCPGYQRCSACILAIASRVGWATLEGRRRAVYIGHGPQWNNSLMCRSGSNALDIRHVY
jgi:hypothetical protein